MTTLVLNTHNIGPSNVLFKRYDSFSTSSGSNRSSITSTESARSSYSRRSDRAGQRRNNLTNTLSNSDPPGDKTRPNTLRDSNQDDDDDTCLFCNTIVNERQYYMWQSNYTKSSFCARCKEDNKSLQYISYWGTSDYQTGSWRKRYRDGRSSDIDLTPLLEVLDRINLIDTSICGMTSKSIHTLPIPNGNTETTNTTYLKPVEIGEVDYKLTERRRRRLLNRETLTKDTDTSTDTTQPLHEKYCHIAVECSNVFESEHVRSIAPLPILQANEIIDQREPCNITHPHRIIRSGGQSSYEEFIAGLDNISNVHRTSTSKYALVDLIKPKDKHKGIVQQQSEHTDISQTASQKIIYTDIKCDEKVNIVNSTYINPNKNEKVPICDTNGNTNDNFKTGLNSPRRRITNEQNKHDMNNTKSELRSERNEVSQKCSKLTNRNQDSVLGYKRKSLKPSQAYKAHCVERRRSKAEVVYNIPENIIEKDETNHEDKLSFRDKRRKFEMMLSTDCQQKIITPGMCGSRYAKSHRKSHDSEELIDEEPREPKTILQTNEFPDKAIECGSPEVKYNIEATLTGANNEYQESANTGSDFETSEGEQNDNNDFTQNKHQAYGASKKTRLLAMNDFLPQSDSDIEYSEDSSSNNNNIDFDISTTISTTDNSSSRSSLCVQTEIAQRDIDSSKILDHYKKIHSRKHSWRRSRRQELTQKDKEDTGNRTDDETSDVPHIERIKKKLGRIKSEKDSESDENGNCIELDVSDNEQMELSWRTRGYNADFFMSRQSVTGSEILDRYNRALSKRRSRKIPRSKDISSRTSVDLDKLLTDSPDTSAQKTATRGNYKRSDDADPMSNSSHTGVNHVALKEALNRAAACSKRLSRRLREQLYESSCDSSS